MYYKIRIITNQIRIRTHIFLRDIGQGNANIFGFNSGIL